MNRLITYSVLLIASCLMVTSCDQASEKKEKKSYVKLILRTNPKGAKVYFDGKLLTETTPLETVIKDHYEHMVELRADGYDSKWLRVRNSHGEGTVEHDFGEIKLYKTKVPLIIKSKPSGAFVNLDGDDLGKTPIYLKGVSPGKHSAVFSFAGHAKMTRKIDLEPGDLLLLNVSLASITGSLTVMTSPANADVFLDGNRKGTSNANGRLVIHDVDEGRHELKVVKAGYYDLKHTVSVQANENVLATIPGLHALPGSIKVVSEPGGGKVYRDGLLMGETPMVLKGLAAKEYTIKVELPGYNVGRKVVTVIPGMTKQVDFTLDSIYGVASVVTKPSECFVIVDGVKRGQTVASDAPGISKPFAITQLKQGVHTVMIEKAGYQSASKQVLINIGKETRVPPIELTKLWLPTHEIKARGEMRSRRVKVLKDDGRNVDIEYKKGIEIIRYQEKKSNIILMREIK
ncbi:hypothetical protein BVX99_03180 [bacterium F16]|nr:hypothetical protein BVX99_03180 [bacterium F16]